MLHPISWAVSVPFWGLKVQVWSLLCRKITLLVFSERICRLQKKLEEAGLGGCHSQPIRGSGLEMLTSGLPVDPMATTCTCSFVWVIWTWQLRSMDKGLLCSAEQERLLLSSAFCLWQSRSYQTARPSLSKCSCSTLSCPPLAPQNLLWLRTG